MDNSKIKRELGIQFRPVETAIVEGAKSLMDRKLVEPAKPYDTILIVLGFSILVAIGAAIWYYVQTNIFK